MVKQRGYPGVSVQGCVRFLPTISEETDQGLEKKALDEILEDNFEAMKKRNNCPCIKQDARNIDTCRDLRTVNEDLSGRTHCMSTDYSPQVLTRQVKASRPEGINEARTLFPDFFPQFTIQGSWESGENSSWKDKPTMEQIFSGHNSDFSRKSRLQDAECDPWKNYQLSF